MKFVRVKSIFPRGYLSPSSGRAERGISNPPGNNGKPALTSTARPSGEEPIAIAADQRNALYHLLLSDLSAYSDLQAAYARGDLEECYRLGRRMTDCMRLIQDGGLGWGDETAESVVQLTLPGEELRRILIAQRDLLITHREATRPEREEIEAEMGLDAVALSGCEDALTQMNAR